MSPARRRQMVDRQHPSLSLVRQCALLGVSRSSLYYRPRPASPEDLSLMGEIDRQYLETPFFGSRRMKAWLDRRGVGVSRKRVQRLMRAMGLRAIYRRPGTSRPAPEHPVYPYLLRNVRITRPNQSLPPRRRGCGRRTSPTCPWPGASSTWCGDGLAQPVRAGLAAIQHPGDRLLRRGAGGGSYPGPARGVQHRPEPAPAKAGGSQFTSLEFTQVLQDRSVRISMDGKGRYQDNIFVERLWRTVKYEEVYLKAYASVLEAQRGLEDYFRFYNGLRPHQSLGYRTPAEVFHGEQKAGEEESNRRRWSPEKGSKNWQESRDSHLTRP